MKKSFGILIMFLIGVTFLVSAEINPQIYHYSTSGGDPYISNTWTDGSVRHHLSCGAECSYVQFCVGSTCTPSGNYGSEKALSIIGQGTTSFKWRGVYFENSSVYYSSIYEYIDRLDNSPSRTSAYGTTGNYSYAFGDVTNSPVFVTLNCLDFYSGCSNIKYCIDYSNSCMPDQSYSEVIEVLEPGTNYIRFFGEDNVGIIESTQSVVAIVSNLSILTRLGGNVILTHGDSFSNAINNYLEDCIPDEDGNCLVPVEFTSSSSEIVEISSVDINFNVSNYLWDISSLQSGQYKLRIKSYDGVGYSLWDESESFYLN